MADEAGARRAALTWMALFSGIAILIAIDIVSDSMEGAGWFHLVLELAVLSLSASGAILGWRRWLQAREELRRLGADLTEVRASAERWRQENQTLLKGLGEAIRAQFEDWGLTGAEAEIGMLLLKGLSLKEIAALRETSERTVREQARSVYRKAGLAGRAELSAFFLEDLLVARTPEPASARGTP
jgi:DNA-binding CsgD family transcriptional regulator